MHRKTSKIALGAIGLTILFLGFVTAESFAIRFKAAQFLNNIRAFRPGRSTFEDLMRLKEKYDKFASIDDSGCDQRRCTVYFYFDNRWLHWTRAVPAARFGGGISVNEGIVSEINMALVSNSNYSAQVVDTVAAPMEPPYVVNGRTSTSVGEFMTVKVLLTPSAPEDMRQKAYSFNLSCLTQFGGCQDGHAMLPKV